MAPQSDASPQPALPYPHDDFLDDDEEIHDDDDEYEDDEMVLIHPHLRNQLPPQPQGPQQPNQPQLQQQQLLQEQPDLRQFCPEELSRLAEISVKFESLGVYLVEHIVLASVSPTPYAANPPVPQVDPPPHARFPPPDSSSENLIDLLTTNRETLTMRRLVTKALIDKSHSFNNIIFILPRIPATVEDFRIVFGAVVDRVVSTAPQQQQGVAAVNDAQEVRDVSWGKLVTAYAFGLRLIKASIDQRRDGDFALQQQFQQLMNQREEVLDQREFPQERLVRERIDYLQLQWERLQRVPIEEQFDPHEWGSALGQVLYDRMGSWVLSRGGFNNNFLDRRGLEQVVTGKLFCVFALGLGFVMLYKLVKR